MLNQFLIKFHHIYTFIPLIEISVNIYLYNWKLEHMYVRLQKSFSLWWIIPDHWRRYLKPSRRWEVWPVETYCSCQIFIYWLISLISFNEQSISNISFRTTKKDETILARKKDNDNEKSLIYCKLKNKWIVKSIPINNSYLPNLKTLSLWFR